MHHHARLCCPKIARSSIACCLASRRDRHADALRLAVRTVGGGQVIGRVAVVPPGHRDGVKAAYIDLDQISFARPAPVDDPENDVLKACNLSVLWPNYRAAARAA
jgi:hypothetical protein